MATTSPAPICSPISETSRSVVLRLRFFADFAKFERLAIRKEFRRSRAAVPLIRAGFQSLPKEGLREGHQPYPGSGCFLFGAVSAFEPKTGRQAFQLFPIIIT